MNRHHTCGRLVATAILVGAVALAVGAGTTSAAPSAVPPGTNLAPTKTYLLEHTRSCAGSPPASARGEPVLRAREGAGFDYAELWAVEARRGQAAARRAKALWIEGNPYYERVEGVVAGTPSLAVYDVILDAGSSAKEDPASAVPFDLKLADGRVLRKPGNLFNLTEGMLWGTRPEYTAKGVEADLDGDGKVEFGEVAARRRASSRPPPTRSSSTRRSSTARRARGSRPRPTRSPRSS